jgi:hypothetical protein
MSAWQSLFPSKNDRETIRAALLNPVALSMADLANAVSRAYSYRWLPSYRKALRMLVPAIESELKQIASNPRNGGDIMSDELLDQLDVLTRVALVYHKHIRDSLLVFGVAKIGHSHAAQSTTCPPHTCLYLLITKNVAVCVLGNTCGWGELRDMLSRVPLNTIDPHHRPRVLHNMALAGLAVRRSVGAHVWTSADDILTRHYAKWATEQVPAGDWHTLAKAWFVRARVFLATLPARMRHLALK